MASLMKNIGEYLPEHELPNFEDWYLLVYPKHCEKVQAKKEWEKLTDLEKHQATIDPPIRLENHAQWKDKQMIPSPRRYLLRKLWTDEIVKARTRADAQKERESEDKTPLGRLWTLLEQTYGQALLNKHGENIPALWRIKLEGITKSEVAGIINYLMYDKERGVPDLPKINRIRNIGRDYSTYNQLQIANPTKPETAQQAINEMYKLLK